MKEAAKDKIDELFADGTAIDQALRRAVREALQRHRQAGFPVSAWREGKIVWIPPEEIPVHEPDS
jgi:hypothetical protein